MIFVVSPVYKNSSMGLLFHDLCFFPTGEEFFGTDVVVALPRSAEVAWNHQQGVAMGDHA